MRKGKKKKYRCFTIKQIYALYKKQPFRKAGRNKDLDAFYGAPNPSMDGW